MNIRALAVGTFVLSTAIGTAAPALGQCEPRWVADMSPGGFSGPFPAGAGSAVYHDADGPGPLEPQLYVTGSFYLAGGTGADSVAKWDGISWKPVHTTPATYGKAVGVFVSTHAHELLAIGNFELDAGAGQTPLGIQVGDHWEPFDPHLRGNVWSVHETTDGTLFALGVFSASGASQPASIVRLDRSGSVAVPCTTDGAIDWIAPSPGGGVIAYGTFTRIENVEALHMARWDGASWTALRTSIDQVEPVRIRGLASMPDGSLVIGGSFTHLGSEGSYSVAIWDGSSWASLGDISCRDIRAMSAARDGTLYIAGDELRTGAQLGKVARWDGHRWSIIGTVVEEIDVYTLGALDEHSVFLGGAYRDIDGTVARGAALWANRRWNSMGGDDRFRPFSIFTVDGFGAIAQGTIINAPGQQMLALAQWSAAGWQPMNIPSPDWCMQFASDSHGDLLALASSFTSFPRAAVVRRWDGVQWVAIGEGLSGYPARFKVLADDRIVVVGQLEVESVRCGAALWNGNSWSSMGSIQQGSIEDIAQMPDGTIIIGGDIMLENATNPTPLAAWIDNHWTDITNQQVTGRASSLAMSHEGSLIAAGNLSAVGTTLNGRIAFAWDGTSFSDVGTALEASYADSPEVLIDIDGMPVIAGITAENDYLNDMIVRWNGQSWERLGGYRSTTDAYYHSSRLGQIALHTSGDILVVGGNLRGVPSLGNRSNLCFSRSPAPRVAQSPTDLTISTDEHIVLNAAVLMNLDEVSYQWYRNGVAIHSGPGGASESGGFVSGAQGTIAGRTDDSLYTLRITNATPGDAGEYTISFTNPCGTALSPVATVTVRCFGDFNHDGGIDGSDMESFFRAWESASIDADANFDGLVDEADANEFIARWANGRC